MTAMNDFAADAAWLQAEWGIVAPGAVEYLPPNFRRNFTAALDAQPTLVTNPNAGIPNWYTTYIDPEVVRVLQTPNKGAQIYGETKVGDWTTQTAMFTMLENTGEVSSYGDFNDNGVNNVNEQFETRQAYLFQTVKIYGDLAVDRAGEAKLALVAELNVASAKTLDKFQDYTYHFGVQGLANYGTLNDPSLPAALTPGTKAAGGVSWVKNGQINATAAEIYADFQTMFGQFAANTYGLIDMDAQLKLVIPNSVAIALTAVNQFGITVRDFMKASFPNVEIITDPRYQTAAGNVIQLIATSFDGAQTGTCAFNVKSHDHAIVQELSAKKQKTTAGSWGAIIKRPLGVVQMLGV